jgi:holo-[acyl-carrier protein] synthase
LWWFDVHSEKTRVLKRTTLPAVFRHRRVTKRANPALRVGIDLVYVDDVATAIERFGARYTERVFTAEERAYCRASNRLPAALRFAARFAAKEAVVKVLRPLRPWSDWRAIEVRRHRSGWCDIRLHNEAAALARRQRLGSIALSITHGGRHVVAVALARVDAARPRRSR